MDGIILVRVYYICEIGRAVCEIRSVTYEVKCEAMAY